MKTKTSISILSGVYLFLSSAAAFVSCQSSLHSGPPNFASDSLVVHFEYFTYKGEDDFYRENPLPGDDFYYNPILPGWYSDPSVCTNGEDYFLVTSSFSYYPGVPIFHSKDLMNWKQVGHVLDRPEQLPLEGQGTSRGIFAPAISYNPHNQTWYMITTNVGRGNFFVKTNDPFGSWSDPIWLPDVHGIDPSFFFDDDGKAYIVNNDEPDGGSSYEGHRAIRVLQFDVENDKTFGPSVMLINGGVDLSEKPIWIEGPHLYKIDGNYMLMCAEGGTSVNHREVIFKSDSPMGKFTPWDKNPILTQKHLDPNRALPITCAGHADLIKKGNGQWWSFFLACRPIDNAFENLGRETFLMPVRWSKDGFPYMTKDDELVPRIVQMKGVKRDSATTFGNFTLTDDFDSDTLGMEWMSLRGPASDLYSLSDDPGYLTLTCADVRSNAFKTPAYLGRRLQHHQFECTTSLYFSPKSESESAGVLLHKDEGHQYLLALSKADEGLKISLQKVSKDGIEVLASEAISPGRDAIRLKVKSDGKHFNFLYASGNEEWISLADQVEAFYLSTANSYGFTGTTIGLFASSAIN